MAFGSSDREVGIDVVAHDMASSELARISSGLHGVTTSAGGAQGAVGRLHGAFTSMIQGIGMGIGMGVFNAITGAIGNMAGAVEGFFAGAISKAGEMERYTVQLEVLLGSTAAAQARLNELVEFAKRTPFELPGVIEASRTLQVFTQGALATGAGLQMIGDIAAGTGRPFQEVAMWVGRLYDAMQSGRPFGESAMRLQEMGAMSGASRQRIEDLAASVKTGAITMKQAWAEAGGEFERFSGLMNRQSGTLEGLLSNLADQIGQSLAGVGDSLLPIVKEVIPQIILFVQTAGNAIATFIRDNAEAIRVWVLQIASFVGGLVAAFFGEAKALDSVTSSTAAATTGIGDYTGAMDGATGASKAATDAYKSQIDHLDRMTDSVKRLDAAQDARFDKEMARLIDAVDAQTISIDAADRQRGIDEQRASGLRSIADAQAAVAAAMDAGADPTDAIQRLSDLRADAAEFELDQSDATRKEELAGVKAYIESIANAENEWASTKGLLGQLGKNEALLNSQIVTATEAGDLQRVSDLTLQLEAVKAAERRAQMAQANEERTQEFADQKARLEDLVKAAGAAGSGMGAGISAGAGTAGAAITNMSLTGMDDIGRLGRAVWSTDDGSLSSAIEEARLAGIKFGEDVKAAINGVIGAFTTLFGWIGDVKTTLDEIANSDIWKALHEPIRFDLDFNPLNPKGPAEGGVGTGLTDIVGDWIGDLLPKFHEGGIVPGPTGAEVLAVLRGGERVVPIGGAPPVTLNATFNVSGATSPEQFAQDALLALRRELTRQSMSLA